MHTRDADEDTVAIMKEELKNGRYEAVIHCYSSSPALGYEAVELGFYLGIGGILTFKRSEELRETVKNIPLDRILLETDAPYLAPEPYRGKKNEPAYVAHVAAKLAEVKQLSVGEIEKATTDNFLPAVQQGRSSGCLSRRTGQRKSAVTRARVRVRILGCGTSSGVPMIGCKCDVCISTDPRNKRRRCAIAIQNDDTTILVDTPPELRLQCVEAGIDRVDALLYTHAHADHVNGLDDMRSLNNVMDRPIRHHRRCQRARKNPFPLRLCLPAAGAGKKAGGAPA